MQEAENGTGLIGILNRLEEYVLAALLAFMTMITFIQVVLRYLFNTGWVWSLEATTYAFAGMVLIGMSYGVRTKSHITVDLVTSRLPPTTRKLIGLLAIAISFSYAALMLYGSSIFVDRLFTLGNMARDIPAPKWLLTSVMPLGFALLGLRLLESGYRIFRGDTADAEKHPPSNHSDSRGPNS